MVMLIIQLNIILSKDFSMKTYISIGQLVQDLREAYAAATKARGFANQLAAKAMKRKTKSEAKTIAAKKHMSRTCSNWNKIRAELKRYEKQLHDGFTVITYSGAISGKYKDYKSCY